MSYKFVKKDFDSLSSSWNNLQKTTTTASIFSTLAWTRTWWNHFSQGYKQYLGEISSDGKAIGIAPLMLKDDAVLITGNEDVCDYLDFIIQRGYEEIFYKTLINHLVAEGFGRLDLLPVREDSSVMTALLTLCQHTGLSISVNQFDVSPYLTLPRTWETYLSSLDRKHRHELNRKQRRLHEHGDLKYSLLDSVSPDQLNIFLELFRSSRNDKALFMTANMELFFRELCSTMAALGYFRLNVLELNGIQIANTVSFDYSNERLLYNSGFDRTYDWLSAGLISKALCIQESIQQGKSKFDFLRGNEDYKYHLGAVDCPIYRCTVLLTNKI
jgi:CelD/BcsL family acetyltransferase involved in cellulose biosynthesis